MHFITVSREDKESRIWKLLAFVDGSWLGIGDVFSIPADWLRREGAHSNPSFPSKERECLLRMPHFQWGTTSRVQPLVEVNRCLWGFLAIGDDKYINTSRSRECCLDGQLGYQRRAERRQVQKGKVGATLTPLPRHHCRCAPLSLCAPHLQSRNDAASHMALRKTMHPRNVFPSPPALSQ